jgi:hypothetical protein
MYVVLEVGGILPQRQRDRVVSWIFGFRFWIAGENGPTMPVLPFHAHIFTPAYNYFDAWKVCTHIQFDVGVTIGPTAANTASIA